MAIAVWKTEYLTGETQIDQEHQELFAIVNQLHTAILQGDAPTQIQAIFLHMADHTIQHFQSEEALMLERSYPGLERHKQTHDALLTKVGTLLQQLDEEEGSPSIKLTEFLTEWLGHHIKGEDQKMIQFFQQKTLEQSIR